ncbi:NELL2-interacting cell ontogeny regulator 1 isoform X2 [Petaurus breviceps papuanus]|uniref:NELL2-interacting cell ontogeny regulator 1 isoform X2 n=1 Tax=Petaurus breviceps papuanus TaxID=3040969 RepID=UPI0036DD0211
MVFTKHSRFKAQGPYGYDVLSYSPFKSPFFTEAARPPLRWDVAIVNLLGNDPNWWGGGRPGTHALCRLEGFRPELGVPKQRCWKGEAAWALSGTELRHICREGGRSTVVSHPSLADPFLGLLGRAQPSARPAGRILAMAARPAAGAPISMLFPLLLLLLAPRLLMAEPAAGSVIPAESRPCVDCHAFEFMQRALQDLKKTAYNLDTRTETLLLQAERRALCECWPAVS